MLFSADLFLFVFFFTMSNQSCVRLFQELRKLKEKALRYSYLTRFIPTRLQVKFDPALGSLCNPLRRQWNNTLHSTSLSLIRILTEHCDVCLNSFNRDISYLEAELRSICSSARFEQFTSEIDAGLTKLESVLISRRNGKIGRLVSKQQHHRRRRFKRNVPTEAEPSAPQSTVINLSSCTLSDAENDLLSKGLNFCPTPPTVNQAELSQDLTDYYVNSSSTHHHGSWAILL